jgi:hypothetical protein
LHTVTNCVEIGISGSSSYPEQKLREESSSSSSKEASVTQGSLGANNPTPANSANSTLMKAEKELKPASLRVKEAAECVLYYLMEHTSSPNILGDNNPDLTRVALDEKSLLELTSKPSNTKYNS